MFDNNYSVLNIYRSNPLLDSEKAILDALFRRWPVGRCGESMALESIAGMGMPLWKRRLNTAAPPFATVKMLSEQISGATFALDFGTYASPWRVCVNYSAGKVVYWSAKANRECGILGSEGDGTTQRTVDRDDKPAAEVLRDIAESFYVHACSNIHLAIVEGIGLNAKEQLDTESHFEAYEAIKELLPDEERAYLGEVERERSAMLAAAQEAEHFGYDEMLGGRVVIGMTTPLL